MVAFKAENSRKITDFFNNYLKTIEHNGVLGIAKFSTVYTELMPVQKEKLKAILDSSINQFLQSGSIICIGICFPPKYMDYINIKKDGKIDKSFWNIYSDE